MKNLAQFGLIAALCGLFAACGSDSGSNSSENELPESIKNFSDIADYECNAARQCAKLYIEEYDDYMQCADGSWETVIETMPIEACAEATNSSSSSVATSSSSDGIPDSDRYSSSSSSKKLSSSSNDESGKSQENESSSSFSGIDPSTVVKGTMTDARDGKTYKTVTIGEQTWMAENLNYAYNEPTTELDSSSFCYNNEPDSCAKYGRLYLWSAAMDSSAIFSDDGKGCGYRVSCETSGYVQGVCPEGWHLPDTTEWRTLYTSIGGTDSAGTMLKSTSGWNDDGNGDDSYGFFVLPAGFRNNNGNFNGASYNEHFWSSTEYNSGYAYGWYFNYDYALVRKYNYDKYYAFSVRCVRNSIDEGSGASSSSSQAQPSSSSSINDSSEYTASTNTLTDLRDGKTYKTVTIGEQTWMAENLNYAYNMPTATEDSSSFCYNNEPDSCAKYGRLYLWSAAMDSSAIFSDDGKECGYRVSCETNGDVRGVCPEGWHLPDTTEWRTLFSTVGGTSSAGTMLKSISGWYDDGNGEDSFGFSVLPAGIRSSNGSFGYAGYYADFWSSTEGNSDYASNWYFNDYYADVYKSNDNKSAAFSVRCVRN